jgi:uncharacterized protein YndB with AHSA1/START domain
MFEGGKHMNKLHFSITIKAPREKVWDTMLSQDTYQSWTEVFGPGSHYVGDWSLGGKILFLAPDETGQMSGMIGRIKENQLYEYVSVEYIGVVLAGEEDTSSEEAMSVEGALENYTFKEMDGSTELRVDMEMDDGEEFVEMFQEIWPLALEKLKELAESRDNYLD